MYTMWCTPFLIGVLTANDLVELIEDEATEDYHRLAGLTEEEEAIFEEGYDILSEVQRKEWITSVEAAKEKAAKEKDAKKKK